MDQAYIERHLTETAKVIEGTKRLAPKIIEAARICTHAIKNGGTIYTCGNGGSAADAQHFSAELINMYKHKDRRPLPSVALTNDSSVLTSIGNDFGAHLIFVKQVQALCRKSDVLVAFSTSGNSDNILRAIDAAKENGAKTIGITGETGGKMKEKVDLLINIPSKETPHIQEGTLPAYHLICDLIEQECVK
jgi:D-sedoheptulose 7-phosphate isomerase